MENETEKFFKGIWVSSKLWLNKNLTMEEKCFLLEIDSLTLSEKGYCPASDEYFSDFFNVPIKKCSNVINTLLKKKCIAEMSSKGDERRIHILDGVM